jgi:hypothetical protein
MTTNPDEVFRVDEAACLRGGEMAGQYLDEIGQTDLGQLNKAQWSLFCQKLVGFSLMFAARPPQNDKPPF